MQFPRSVAVGLTVLGVLGISAGSAPQENNGATSRRLDPDTVSVQLLLGVGDREARSWGGRVKVDRGEILGVEGYRFHKNDLATGRDSWQAKSHVVRKFAAKLDKGKATSTVISVRLGEQPIGAGQKSACGKLRGWLGKLPVALTPLHESVRLLST